MVALDTEWFRWVNDHHCGVSDWVLWTLSQAWSWAIVLAAVWLFLAFAEGGCWGETNRLARERRHHWWLLLAGIALCFLLSDRISVMGFKDVFQRLRPCHALEGVRMFRTHCGGRYGFVSSHAANVFALAMFLSLWACQWQRRWSAKCRRFAWLPILLFAWAMGVGYSRPYLGKHYPGDVICGALVGLLVGLCVYWIIAKIAARVASKSGA